MIVWCNHARYTCLNGVCFFLCVLCSNEIKYHNLLKQIVYYLV